MIQYKYETNFRKEDIFYSNLFLIENSDIEFDSHSQDEEQIIQDFRFFLEKFNAACFVEEDETKRFCEIYYTMKNENIEFPLDELFNSSFPDSLINSIQQLLDENPKGDRILSPYIYALSYIICLDNSFFKDVIIEIILEIIDKFSNFIKTLLHSLVCLIYTSQSQKYDQLFVSQIDQLLILAQDLPNVNNSQAIVIFSHFLLNLSMKDIDPSNLQSIAQILIHYAKNPIALNDMEGALWAIYNFISISIDNLILMVDSGLIQDLPYNKNNYVIADIVLQLINAQCFEEFLFSEKVASQLLGFLCIKIYEPDDNLKIKCINIMNNLIITSTNQSDLEANVFLQLFKKSVIFDKLCDDIKDASFKLKNSTHKFIMNLAETRDIEMVYRITEENVIEFLIDVEQMLGFLNIEKLIYILEICIEFCDDEEIGSYLEERLDDVKDNIPD